MEDMPGAFDIVWSSSSEESEEELCGDVGNGIMSGSGEGSGEGLGTGEGSGKGSVLCLRVRGARINAVRELWVYEYENVNICGK